MLPDDDYASLVPNPPTIFGLTELRDAYIDAVADEENPRPMAEERRAYFDGLCGLFDFDLPTSRKAVGWNRARYVHGLVLNAAKSLLRTGSPWDGYLEAGALLEALDDLGIGEAHRSMAVELRTDGGSVAVQASGAVGPVADRVAGRARAAGVHAGRSRRRRYRACGADPLSA